jgi:KaiC/GvpD/RAD55 family RecA-like ATPase
MEGRCKSGVKGLDKILHGGIPRNSCILLAGGPGSGKTILSTQFLHQGISLYNEPGLYVTFDEATSSLKKNMLKFGWDLTAFEEKKQLRILDLSSLIYLTPEEYQKTAYGVNIPEFTILSVLQIIKDNISEIAAKRIIVDSITSLSIFEIDEAKKRRNLAQFFKGLREMDCTCIITAESNVADSNRDYQLEEYLADGVILLNLVTKKDFIIRSIMIEKMRGIAHDTQPKLYSITDEGFVVYPEEKIL